MNVQQEIGTRSGEARTQDEHSILNPHLWFRFCLRPGLKFLTVFLLLFSLQAKAESHLMFEKANQLYHNRLYDSAAGLYQQMINDGYCDPALFYNAGNVSVAPDDSLTGAHIPSVNLFFDRCMKK